MSIYRKKLRSLDDLEKEKKLLQQQLDQLDATPLIDTGFLDIRKRFFKKTEGENESNSLGSLLSFLPEGNGLLTIVKSFLANKSNVITGAIKTPVKKIVLPVAKEIITGYLKWKAIELSYKLIRKTIRAARKKQPETEKA